MITGIEIIKKKLHFHAPFSIAYETVDTAEIIIIKLTTQENIIGYGSAAPDEEVTGETVNSVYKLLQKHITKDFFDMPLNMMYAYHEKIQKTCVGFPSACHAVEEALLNIFCLTHKISLVNLFGGYREKTPLSMTIGIKNKTDTLHEVEKRIKEGYPLIKLKVGLNINDDVERIQSCLAKFSKKAKFMIDANQGYSLEDAITLCNSIPQNGEILFIEQPVDAKKIHDLKTLKSLTKIPVLADESVVTFDDAFRLLTQNMVDGINIKLMKCGGPINFIRLFHLAKSLQKIVIIGCMYESTISITTGTSLALALPVDYADLDSGHIDFSDDPVEGGAVVERGYLRIKSPLRLHL